MRLSTGMVLPIVAAMIVSLATGACSDAPRPPVEDGSESRAERAPTADPTTSGGPGEHAGSTGSGEHGEHERGDEHGHGEEGEESGEYMGKAETWDATRNGARLVLSFDIATGSFVGTVENTESVTLCAVRVEIHLSTHVELGPTERTDLPPGEKAAVNLSAEGETFESWTAHPEVSACRGA